MVPIFQISAFEVTGQAHPAGNRFETNDTQDLIYAAPFEIQQIAFVQAHDVARGGIILLPRRRSPGCPIGVEHGNAPSDPGSVGQNKYVDMVIVAGAQGFVCPARPVGDPDHPFFFLQ
jgi:hypothetical protein